MTAPLAQSVTGSVDYEHIHVTCCDGDYPYALCGTDVSDGPFVPHDTPTDCIDCSRREPEDCDAVCPRLLFGEDLP